MQADILYDVLVENEDDRIKLNYLIEIKGIEKIRLSVAKYRAKYPESMVFVSTLLRWHHISVPRSVYRPKLHPKRYYFYILTLADHSACKLGYTSNIVQRCYGIHRSGASPSIFDFNESYLKRIINMKTVIRIENVLKAELHCSSMFCPYQSDSSTGFYFGSIAPTEWFSYKELERALCYMERIDSGFDAFTLQTWVTNDKRDAADAYRARFDMNYSK